MNAPVRPLELSEFADPDGKVLRAVRLTAVSVRFRKGYPTPTLEQWRDCRVRIDLNRKLRVIDATLAELYALQLMAPLWLKPSDIFAISVDDVRDLVEFEFEGALL